METVYKPWEIVEIKSYTVFESVDDFVENSTNQIPVNATGVGILFWGNGVLFRFVPLAAAQGSDRLAESLLRGKVIWESVELARMVEYMPELKVPTKPMFALRVNNVTNNTLFGPVTKWMSKQILAAKTKRGKG